MQDSAYPFTRAERVHGHGVDSTTGGSDPATAAAPKRRSTRPTAPTPTHTSSRARDEKVDDACSENEYYYYRNPSRIDSAYVNGAAQPFASEFNFGNGTPPSAGRGVVLESDEAAVVEAIAVQPRRARIPKKFVLTTEMCMNMASCPRCRGQGCSTCQWGMRRASYADYRREMKEQGEHFCALM